MARDLAGAARMPLFIQRLALSAFMGAWAVDKFLNPQHTADVFANFYGIDLATDLTWIVGLVQLAIILAFLVGFLKTGSYLLMFLLHAVSTVSSYEQYVRFPEGLLFWAAIPVLAAFWLQFALRRYDTIALDDRLGRTGSPEG